MKSLYSRSQPHSLLHVIQKFRDAEGARINLTPEEEFLQVGFLRLPAGKAVRAHQHLEQVRTTTITQEAWVVVRGRIRAFYYDLDGSLLESEVLEAGDCSVTFRGGHTFESLEAEACLYEIKSGPYYGQQKDLKYLEQGGNENK